MSGIHSENNSKMYLCTLLEKVLNGDFDFCGLCYKKLNECWTDVDDEVVIHENNIQKRLKLYEVLYSVLGVDVFNDISMFPSVCIQCVSSAVDTYKFVNETRENVRYLSTAIENLLESFEPEQMPANLELSDTLFLTLNPENVTVAAQFYDNVSHIRTKHEAWERFRETLCKPKTEQEKVFIEEKFKCSTREKVTKVSTKEMVHKNDVSELTCKECLKEFPSVSNLRAHFLRLHAPKHFKCSVCSKSFATLSMLNAHKANNHVHIVCSECGKSFKSVQKYNTHQKDHCKRIICPNCGRTYKNQNTYKKHLDNDVCQTAVRHSPSDAKFTCDYCNKKYTQKISLRVHIQYEHLNYKYLECKWCPKKFWCQARLKAHSVKHTKEKNFPCSICGGKFVTKESLLYHTRIHTGEKPYPCDFCDSKFLSASRRRAHVKSQHINPTVKCDICHAMFKSLNYLQKHKQIHEPKLKQNYSNHDRIDIDKNIENPDKDIENFREKNKPYKEEYINYEEDVKEEKVYNMIETDENVYEIQPQFTRNQKQSKKVEFVLLNPHNELPRQLKDSEKIYLEISGNGEFNIREVSENVEV